MSDMMFREPNQVKWQGSRPGHNGTQILEGLETAVVGVTILYTVPAAKTGFITFLSLTKSLSAAAHIYLDLYDDTPAQWRRIFAETSAVGHTGAGKCANFWPPIELPAGYSVRIDQSANVLICGAVHGWYE